MKKSAIAALMAAGILQAAATAPVAVKWEMGENYTNPHRYSSRFVVTNVSDSTLGTGWGIYYNVFANDVATADGSPVAVSEIVPNYYVMRPTDTYQPLAPGDSTVVEVMMHGTFTSRAFAPDGGHFAYDKQLEAPVPLAIEIAPLDRPSQWSVPNVTFADYPDGTYIYRLNESINPDGAKFKGSAFDIFPTPKSINETGGSIQLTSVAITATDEIGIAADYLREKLNAAGISIDDAGGDIKITLSLLPAAAEHNEGYYELQVKQEGAINIAGVSVEGILNGVKTLVAAIETRWAITAKELPCVEIIDYPDLEFRGVMLDVARNFTSYDNLKQLVDLLAGYKINYFTLHFCDDEAWRIEIPGLPELTSVGSRKGLTLDEKEFLAQTYRGNGNPNDTTTTANGYYTREQFVDFLRYATSRGMKVIPEIETPGHSRAAIVSMKHRYAQLVDTDQAEAQRYILWDDRDTSVYTSAQGFHDNILCIGREGTYNFIEKVVDELAMMYEEAGLKLEILHIGGDEVPDGSWEGSPIVHEMMREHGLATVREAHEYFIDRVTAMLQDKEIKAMGWQEVGLGHSDKFNARVAPRFAGVNAWSTVGSRDVVTYTLANDGYPVVLCGVNNFYFDMVYSRHQDEDGLSWGGATDEFTTWQAQPFDIYRTRFTDYNGRPIDLRHAADGKPQLLQPQNIIGVEGKLFAETIRNYGMVQSFIFPKLFGLAERGWNVRAQWGGQYDNLQAFYHARQQYNLKIGSRELPRLFNKGVNFHLGAPGITVDGGMLHINARYPGVEVRYTLDGSQPTRKSPLWTTPVATGDAQVVKARAYYLGKESVATILNINPGSMD